MQINGIAFRLSIVATDAAPDNYVVETVVGDQKPKHYAVGPSNEIGAVVMELCEALQRETSGVPPIVHRIDRKLDDAAEGLLGLTIRSNP